MDAETGGIDQRTRVAMSDFPIMPEAAWRGTRRRAEGVGRPAKRRHGPRDLVQTAAGLG